MKKSVQCSMVDKAKILCGNGNVMVAPPSENSKMSNTTTDLSSELPSKPMAAPPAVNDAIMSNTATDL